VQIAKEETKYGSREWLALELNIEDKRERENRVIRMSCHNVTYLQEGSHASSCDVISADSCKYITKYVFKGHDHTTLALADDQNRNE
jgi:hypothetical protein